MARRTTETHDPRKSAATAGGTAVPVNRGRLARLLRAFRHRLNIPLKDVDTRLLRGHFSHNASGLLSHGATRLESMRHRDALQLTVTDLQQIAYAYQIPRLMLDPLLSVTSGSSCIIANFHNFREVLNPGAPYLGHHVRYRIPETSLADTDEVAFVCLDLEAGGKTDTHAHPGTEFVFVLEGRVELRLDNSGLRTRLDAGDYIHFYSEEPHSAHNFSDAGARVLVIRFYQLDISRNRAGSRFQFLKDLTDLMKEISQEKTKRRSAILVARLVDEIAASFVVESSSDTMRDASGSSREGEEVIDRSGLARLLRQIRTLGLRGDPMSLQQLADRAKERKLPFSRSRIDRLHNGLAPLRRDELGALAELYNVKPFLFYNFLYPSRRHAIVVRGKSSRATGAPTDSAERDDYRQVPADFVGEEGVHFMVPRRRLTDSDIAIVLVELDPHSSTPINRHPGHELILLLRGTIVLQFGDMSKAMDSPNEQYAHYLACFDHCILNQQDVPARFLVIRFHE